MDNQFIYLESDSRPALKWLQLHQRTWPGPEHSLSNFNAILVSRFIRFDSEADKLEFILTYG